MSKTGSGKSTKLGDLKDLSYDEQMEYFKSQGLDIDSLGMKAAPDAGETVAVPDAKEIKITPIPKQSKLYIFGKYVFDDDKSLQSSYKSKGGVEGYLQDINDAFQNPKHSSHQESVQFFKDFEFLSPEDAVADLGSEGVEKIVDGWIANEPSTTGKKKFESYKKLLKAEGIITEVKKPVAVVAEAFKLEGDPKYNFSKDFINGTFQLKNNIQTRDLRFSARIPVLAKTDLENQKPILQKALADLAKMNNFKKEPNVAINEAEEGLDFYYGTEADKIIGLHLDISRVEDALKASAKLPGGFKGVDLKSYKEAKELVTKHADFDFKTGDRGPLRDSIVNASKKVREFEAFLFNLGARDTKDKVKVADFARNEVYSVLWEKEAGADKIDELYLKKAQKIAAEMKSLSSATVPAAPDAKSAPEPKVKPGAEAKDATKKDPWTEPLPWSDVEFKKNAQAFWEEVEKNFKGGWAEFLVDRPAKKKKGKNGLISQYADKFSFSFPTILKLAASRVFKDKKYNPEKEFFESLLGLSKNEVMDELSKVLDIDVLPSEFDSKVDWLKVYIIDKIPPQKRLDSKTDTPTVGDSSSQEDQENESTEGSSSTVEDPEDNSEVEPEVDSDPEVEVKANLENPWEQINQLIQEQGELTEEIVTEATGLEGNELQNFLSSALEEIGYLEDFNIGLKQYEAQISNRLLVRALNEYSKLYFKKQEKNKTKTEAGGEEGETTEKAPQTPKVPLLEGYEIKKIFPNFALLENKLTGLKYFGLIKEDGMQRLPLPEGFDSEDKTQRAALEKAVAELQKESPNFTPSLKVSGGLTGKADDKLVMTLEMAGQKLEIVDKDFTNLEKLHPSEKEKPRHNQIFKVLLLERLNRYQKIEAGKLTEEDKKQITITKKVLEEASFAPQIKARSFAEQIQLKALMAKMAGPARAEKKAA